MANITQDEIRQYVEKNIQSFHDARIKSLSKLRLGRVLRKKNPYLFKAKHVVTPRDLVKALLDAYLSSQEEAILGGFLESLAVFICSRIYNGRKSTSEGVDLEFERKGVLYIVSIKSGPSWGNSSQIKAMRTNFAAAIKRYKQNKQGLKIEAINGCCYGRQQRKSESKGDYTKLCGQRFWQFISGDSELYTRIIEPLGHRAKERNDFFQTQYELVVDAFTQDFRRDFCSPANNVLWEKLAQFASAEVPPKLSKTAQQ
jgi:hypothetical protein